MCSTVTEIPPFDPKTAGPGYMWRHVANHMTARISAGEWPPDSLLPGERKLADEYGVAVNTIRRAFDELREQGLVTTFAAKGTYVTRRDDD
jgi:DNA-binding GntR family transcriptional regulator